MPGHTCICKETHELAASWQLPGAMFTEKRGSWSKKNERDPGKWLKVLESKGQFLVDCVHPGQVPAQLREP